MNAEKNQIESQLLSIRRDSIHTFFRVGIQEVFTQARQLMGLSISLHT